MEVYNTKWNSEYEKGGIPSTNRDRASYSILWYRANLPFLPSDVFPSRVMDVGCGMGRNAFYFAASGADVIAFEASEIALQKAKQKSEDIRTRGEISFLRHDLNDGLPAEDGTMDLVLDMFVYKHQLFSEDRKNYRKEMHRVLSPEGYVLVSLAHEEDGFYQTCPDIKDADPENPKTVMDETVEIGSVLYREESLIKEFSDFFEMSHLMIQEIETPMHDGTYVRKILSGIFKKI